MAEKKDEVPGNSETECFRGTSGGRQCIIGMGWLWHRQPSRAAHCIQLSKVHTSRNMSRAFRNFDQCEILFSEPSKFGLRENLENLETCLSLHACVSAEVCGADNRSSERAFVEGH